MQAHGLLTPERIAEARKRLPPEVRRTPLLPLAVRVRETGAERLHLKLENLQITGAYKVRSAFSMLTSLSSEEQKRGVVLTSSGNFAQGFAFAGRTLGIPVVVIMLTDTSEAKVAGTIELGAEVVLFDGPALDRQQKVEAVAAERGMRAIDTWEEPEIVAGHASLGLEIIEDFPMVEQILVPVSSGGMAAGVLAAVKAARPDVRIVGVQPRRANAAYVSLKSGQPTSIDYWNTIADGLSARRPGEFPFSHIQALIDDIVLVEESDIGRAHLTLRDRGKVFAEAAGAVAAAGFLSGKVDTTMRTVAVVSGGNLTEKSMAALDRLGAIPGETELAV